MVTRLGPGYFAQCMPAGCLRAGPISGKVVGPTPAPDGTLAAVGYRVLLRDGCGAPLITGDRDPAYGAQAGSAFSIGLPPDGVGKVVDGSNGRIGV